MIPWINYIELHRKAFPDEEKGQPSRCIFFSYNVTFLRELKVQKKPTFFFFLPQFIIDSGSAYANAEKSNGSENWTFRQVWP